MSLDTSAPDIKADQSIESESKHESTQALVLERYHRLLEEQVSNPDKVFIDGYTLRDLDSNFVTLDKNAHEHPRAWPARKKVLSTVIIAVYVFLSPFASTIFSPSVHLIMADLGITNSTEGALTVSIFLFAYAIGPLFMAPLSEIYGRTIILNTGNLIFVIFSIGAGFAQTPAQFFVLRLLSGLGGSSPLSVVGGFIADIWDLKDRAKASGLVMLGPVLGPILGPVCGGWMSQGASWRWTLWVPAIASGFLAVIGFLFMPESYAPRVLEQKLRREQKARSSESLYTVAQLVPQPTSLGYLISQFNRPIVYLILDPALLLASLFYAVVFGIVYLVIVTLADVFGTGYGHSVGIIGTDFLAAGVGMIIGTFGTIKAMDVIYKKDAAGKAKYKPESRLLTSAVGGLITASGLFLYGFSALKTHFIVPLIGIAIFAIGAMNVMMAIQLYAVDGFKFPASAFASISVLRCLFAGAFPLFGPDLFKKLGVDWGVGLLAFLTLGLGLPLVALLYIRGPQFRRIGVERMERFEGRNKM